MPKARIELWHGSRFLTETVAWFTMNQDFDIVNPDPVIVKFPTGRLFKRVSYRDDLKVKINIGKGRVYTEDISPAVGFYYPGDALSLTFTITPRGGDNGSS